MSNMNKPATPRPTVLNENSEDTPKVITGEIRLVL